MHFIQRHVFNIDVEYLLETNKNNSIDENIDDEYENAIKIANLSDKKIDYLKNNYKLKTITL